MLPIKFYNLNLYKSPDYKSSYFFDVTNGNVHLCSLKGNFSSLITLFAHSFSTDKNFEPTKVCNVSFVKVTKIHLFKWK